MQDNSHTAPFERDDWWEPNGAFQMLHHINPLRLQWLQGVAGGANGALRGKRLLDVGCGGGVFAEAAARAGAVVTGVDAAAAAIAAARRHAQDGGLAIQYHHGAGARTAPDDSYDIITCFEMLEHARDPAGEVAAISQKLAPGGIAAFSTINRTPRAWLQLIVAMEHLARVIPLGTHEYAKFIRPSELADWCRQSGLAPQPACGLTYSFFGHFFRLAPHDTGANYFLAAHRPAAA